MDGKGKSFSRSTLGSSTFVQAVGTKPGPNGTTLVSSGLGDLDKILGGGVPLGGIVMIMEDIDAPHHLLFLRYFLAQGVVHGQPLLFTSPITSPKSFLGTLPDLTKGKDNKANPELQKSGQSADCLKIAWQYQRYLNEQKALEARRHRQQEITTRSWVDAHLHGSNLSPSLSSFAASGSLEYTSTFDLRKSMDQAPINMINPVCLSLQGGADMACLREQCSSFVTRHARLLEAQHVGRIALQSLCAPQSMHMCSEWMVLSFLAWLKGIVRTSNVVVFVTIPASLLAPSLLVRLQHLAEILLSVEAVSDNHKEEEEAVLLDYQDISGLLHVHKLASINSQVPFFPEATTYAIKVLRRKEIVLEHLHLAPIDAQSKDSRFSGAATQVGCGSPADVSSSLHF